jgi:hypothetical protein
MIRGKYIFYTLVVLGLLCGSRSMVSRSRHGHGRGGRDGFTGGLVGGMVGGMVAGAVTKDRGTSRAEQEARLAQERTRQLEQQQEKERLEQLRRDVQLQEQMRKDQEMKQMLMQTGGISWQQIMLFIFIFFLLMLTVLIAFALYKRRL